MSNKKDISYLIFSDIRSFSHLFTSFIVYFFLQTHAIAHAENTPHKTQNALYSGGNYYNSDWFAYSTAVRSLWSGIHDHGWQVRVMAGKGLYHYQKVKVGTDYDLITFGADKSVLEAMIGYQYSARPYFIKAYLGPSMEIHTFDPRDISHSEEVQKYGAKVLLESWIDIGEDNHFVSFDASFSTLDHRYALNAKAGLKPLLNTHIGVELEWTHDDLLERASAGGFLRYQWRETQAVSLAAGGTKNGLDEDGFYARIGYDVKF